jgi:hypothetical protein
MTTGRNTLAEAIEAWRALSEEQRGWYFDDLAESREAQAEAFGDKRVAALDAVEALLRAVDEPEAKDENPNTCPESSLLAWGAHLIDEEKKGGGR